MAHGQSKVLVSASFFLLAGLLVTHTAAAKCDPAGADAAAVAAARGQVAQSCDCAGAANHGAYVSCARGVLSSLVAADQLPASCRGTVQADSARSTCGRPGTVTCCTTSRQGKTTGSIKSSAGGCRAPHGGSACVGNFPSLSASCDAAGCVAKCGNGVTEPGEDCDPPDGTLCDASCHHIPGCGDGIVNGSEECDGSAGDCYIYQCGGPGDALACQCCASGNSVLIDILATPPPCCDGSACRVYAPHSCTCDPTSCMPAGAPCTLQVGCCPGLTCNGFSCQ